MDDYGDPRFGYSNWLDGGPDRTSKPTAEDLKADYLPLETDDEQVAESMACPNCGERRMEQLVSNDGQVHCATCGTDYEV